MSARSCSASGVQTTFTLDRLQVSLDAARTAVVHANRKLVADERQVRAVDTEYLNGLVRTTFLQGTCVRPPNAKFFNREVRAAQASTN